MKYKIAIFLIFVILLGGIYVYQYENNSPCIEPVRTEDITFIYFCTNKANTKASLSFCLRDESEQSVLAQIERSDSGNIHINLWRGDDAYKDSDQNTFMLIPKSSLPGLTQCVEKGGKVVKGKAISGFNVMFEINPSTLENYVIIGGERISLKDRGVIFKSSKAPLSTTSWPFNF